MKVNKVTKNRWKVKSQNSANLAIKVTGRANKFDHSAKKKTNTKMKGNIYVHKMHDQHCGNESSIKLTIAKDLSRIL